MSLVPLYLSTAKRGRQHQSAVWLRDVAVYFLAPEPLIGTTEPCLSLTKKERY